MTSITTKAVRMMPCRRAGGWLRQLPWRLVLLASLAFGVSGCANRYPMGAGTALAVEAMVVAAEQQRAAGDRGVPVGAYAARAEERLATAPGDDDDGEDE